MKVLLLLSLLALAEAGGARDASPLQSRSKRISEQDNGKSEDCISIYIMNEIDDLAIVIDDLKGRVEILKEQLKESAEQGQNDGQGSKQKQGGQSDSGGPDGGQQEQGGEPDSGGPDGGQQEQGGQSASGRPEKPGENEENERLNTGGSETNQKERKEKSGGGDSQNQAMRILVQQIKSRLADMKREQTRI